MECVESMKYVECVECVECMECLEQLLATQSSNHLLRFFNVPDPLCYL